MKKNATILLIASFVILISCKENEIIIDSGTADFSRYLAVGNSLTAGYADGGLYREAQLASYPSILALQMNTEMSQPLMPEGNGSGYIYLTSYVNGIPGFNFLNADPAAYDKVTGDFNNLGIPGIRVKDITNASYGLEENNRYLYRILSPGSETGTTYLDLIDDTDHTFFTCWMGNNDILGFAMDGGSSDGIDLTELTEFEQNYSLLLDVLKKGGAKGVLLTIPDVSLIPFFNLVSNDDFPELDEESQSELSGIYEGYNEAVMDYNMEIENDGSLTVDEKNALKRPLIHFTLDGPNAFVIEDTYLPGDGITDGEGIEFPKIRHLEEGEKITLTGVLEITNFTKLSGIRQPLEDRFVLTARELELLKGYKDDYNTIISGYQEVDRISVINTDQLLQQFNTGKIIDGEEISVDFIDGGLFSLDGVHLTPKGNAIVSNEIIKAINQHFSANLPVVRSSGYRGVEIP